MQCLDFQRRLQTLLDQRIRPETDAKLRRHADACHGCREMLTAQNRLFAGLNTLGQVDASPGFSQRVVAQFRPARRPYPVRSLPIVAIATAATLLIVIVPLFRTDYDHYRVAHAPTTQVEPISEETGNAAAKLDVATGSRHSDTTVGQSMSQEEPEFDAGEFREIIHDFVARFSDETLQPVDQIADGFRPLATTLNVAIDALRKTLPVGRDKRPSKPQADATKHYRERDLA